MLADDEREALASWIITGGAALKSAVHACSSEAAIRLLGGWELGGQNGVAPLMTAVKVDHEGTARELLQDLQIDVSQPMFQSPN